MSEDNIKTGSGVTPVKPKKRRAVWRVALKTLGWVAAGCVGLLLLVMCVVAWYLTPERLTPLVEKYGSEYLKADVRADRVELTVWSSFPQVRLDVTGLNLTSRTLQGQPDSIMAALPADASRLLRAGKISGSINPWKLLGGVISLGDIAVSGAELNLVSYNDKINNFDILPPSGEKEKKEEEPWNIRFGDITLDAPGGIRYYDAKGGMLVSLDSPSVSVHPLDADCRRLHLAFNTPVTFATGGRGILTSLPIALQGDIAWTMTPLSVSTDNLAINLAGVQAQLKAGFKSDSQPELTACRLHVDPVELLPLAKLLPEDTRRELSVLDDIDSDLKIGLEADVATPYFPASGQAPSVNVDFTIPECHFAMKDTHGKDMLRLDRIKASGAFLFNGAHPDASRLEIPVFDVEGQDVNLKLTATADEVLSADPRLTLTSRGQADLSAFAGLIPLPGVVLKGMVDADASIKCHLSDLLDMKYENVDADGSVEIRGLLCSLPVLTTELYARVAKFSFGNNMTSRDSGRLITGLLRAEADIDTLYCEVPGISLGIRGANLQAGATEALLKKRSPKEIVPMGVRLTASRITAASSTDTMQVLATALDANGSVSRYEGGAESALLKASLKADRLRYTDPSLRLRTRNLDADIAAHLRERGKNTKSPYQRRYDAIARRNPGLSPDSIAKLASRPRRTVADPSVVRVELDNGIKALFRQWGIRGHVNSDRVAMTYIAYPVRTIIENLAFDFSLDSLRLHQARIRSEENSMTLSGTVSNMRQMMLGRVRTPLKIRFDANVDNLNLNRIAYNYRLGQALQTQRGYLARISPDEEDALVRAAAAVPVEASPADTVPLLVPRNIDAVMKLRANTVTYDNLLLRQAGASIAMNDGAFSVDSLTALTDFGDAYLNLIYSSRDIEKMNIALDVGMSNVHLNDLMTTFPQIPEMMPMITNLDGMVGARLAGSVEMFPNMDLDIASLNAMLNISGSGLTLQQDPTIRKIARMMFIRKKGALTIDDMNVQVAVHDNVLRLYPFRFGLEKYKFALLGENDLAGNMYYHLSVLKSPVPFRFGLNIKGTFDKPKFRFGGPKYKENEAIEMVNLIEGQRVNFVKAMRLELHKLINKAALSYTDSPEYHRYGQDEEKKRQDDGGDDSQYENPVDMVGSKLKAPIIKALNINSNTVKTFMERQNDAKNKKNKKKNK